MPHTRYGETAISGSVRTQVDMSHTRLRLLRLLQSHESGTRARGAPFNKASFLSALESIAVIGDAV